MARSIAPASGLSAVRMRPNPSAASGAAALALIATAAQAPRPARHGAARRAKACAVRGE